MDSRLEWKEEYSIGVESIDKEHRRLFKIITKLLAFVNEEKEPVGMPGGNQIF